MKRLRELLLASVLITLSFCSVEAMNSSRSMSQEESFDLKQPLAEWPRIHPFNSQSEMNYYKNETWSFRLTLKENQEALVEKFVDNCCDFSSAAEYKDQFIKYFSNIVKHPVGCKFLRVFLARGVVNKLHRVTFSPVDKSIMKGRGAMSYAISSKGKRKIFFPPDLQHRSEKFVVRRKKSSKEFFLVSKEVCPIDISLVHEMIHHYHPSVDALKKSKSVSAIKKRLERVTALRGEEKFDALARVLYNNDEEFHTMFGITEQGWDSINESAYSSDRYGFIPFSHTSGDDMQAAILKDFINSDLSDKDLYRSFLVQKFKSPKFGVGQYECADLNPETGERIQ